MNWIWRLRYKNYTNTITARVRFRFVMVIDNRVKSRASGDFDEWTATGREESVSLKSLLPVHLSPNWSLSIIIILLSNKLALSFPQFRKKGIIQHIITKSSHLHQSPITILGQLLWMLYGIFPHPYQCRGCKGRTHSTELNALANTDFCLT